MVEPSYPKPFPSDLSGKLRASAIDATLSCISADPKVATYYIEIQNTSGKIINGEPSKQWGTVTNIKHADKPRKWQSEQYKGRAVVFILFCLSGIFGHIWRDWEQINKWS